LPLARDARGRPQLHAPLDGFDTNWSHSGQRLLLALGEGLRLGIDVELVRPRPRVAALAERYFHPDEAAWLRAQPDATRLPAFVRLWCAKEAVLKAHGEGIAFGLEKLRFGEHDGQLRLDACAPALGTPADWALHEWAPEPGYRAALAASGDNRAMTNTPPARRPRCRPRTRPGRARPRRRLAPRLLDYLALLHRWNGTYNLTAIRDPRQMVVLHLLDSLAMAPFLADAAQAGASLADLGTGPGLPGIPLAIALPGLRVTLVESNGKKARFLREAVRKLGLGNARVAESRAEALDEPGPRPAHRARAGHAGRHRRRRRPPAAPRRAPAGDEGRAPARKSPHCRPAGPPPPCTRCACPGWTASAIWR
jgi:4'-phosphopantetheinyl transferase